MWLLDIHIRMGTFNGKSTDVFITAIVSCMVVTFAWLPVSAGECLPQLLTSWSGEVRHPSIQTLYNNGEHCVWHIRVSKGNKVEVTFTKFSLQKARSGMCDDYVKITEGSNEMGRELGRFCGGTLPVKITSSANELTIIFHSDNVGHYPGFELSYTGICRNITIEESDVTIQSPNYPDLPPENTICEWSMIVPDGLFLLLLVNDFKTESNTCNDSFVAVYPKSGNQIQICQGGMDTIAVFEDRAFIQYDTHGIQPIIMEIHVKFQEPAQCGPSTCNKAGTCTSTLLNTTCQCDPGYSGLHCEHNIDDCQPDPCVHGDCVDGQGTFRCDCIEGFIGELCDICGVESCVTPVDYCIVNLCTDGATCLNNKEGYSCQCPPDKTGQMCDDFIDSCQSNPCPKNNSACKTLDEGYRCECLSGFTGNTCDVKVNKCNPNPCASDGVCSESRDVVTCICRAGTAGQFCEEDIDACSSNPCQNTAPCVHSGDGFICECPLGFTGELCDIDINECESTPCQQKGYCTDFINSFHCACAQGFTGETCEMNIDDCTPSPCGPNGLCEDQVNSYKCTCDSGFAGRHCERNINDCFGSPCRSNGTCLDEVNGYTCVCINGFRGRTCEVNEDDCDPNPCHHSGQCVDLVGMFRCECYPQYIGRVCEEYIYKDLPHCDYAIDDNEIHWHSTRTGMTDIEPCPIGSVGNATRDCVTDRTSRTGGRWDIIDLKLCVRTEMLSISLKATELLSSTTLSEGDIIKVTSELIEMTSPNMTWTLYPGDLGVAADTVGVIARAIGLTSDHNSDVGILTDVYGDVVENIITTAQGSVWRQTKDSNFAEEKLSHIVGSAEIFAENIVPKMSARQSRYRRSPQGYDDYIAITRPNFEMQIVLGRSMSDLHKHLVYSGSHVTSSISLPDSLVQLPTMWNSDQKAMYNGRFPSLASILDRRTSSHNSSQWNILNSDVISAHVIGVDVTYFTNLDSPVVIHMELRDKAFDPMIRPMCAFLNVSSRSETTRWLTEGCTVFSSNNTHVVCHCSHLTNFAVLMDVHGVMDSLAEGHKQALSFISYIGGTCSIVGCLLAIAVFEYFKLQSDRIRIHQSLAVSIILVQLIFLIGIDRTENMYVCKVFAALLHYALLSQFCWMMVEGVHLYFILVKVFKKGSHLRKYALIGWGIPLVIVGVSVGVFYKEYGEGGMCWMTQFMLLVMFVPIAAIIILLNVFVLVVVIRVMGKSMVISGKSKSEEYSVVRSSLKAAFILLPLLGLTWAFGFLSINATETLLFTYLFTTCNCLQGVLFFIYHCVLNVDVKKAFAKRYNRKGSVMTKHSGDKHTLVQKGSMMRSSESDFPDSVPSYTSSVILSQRSSSTSTGSKLPSLHRSPLREFHLTNPKDEQANETQYGVSEYCTSI